MDTVTSISKVSDQQCNTDTGLRVLLRAGPNKGREVVGRRFMPYDTKVISAARHSGLTVLLD